MPLREISKDEAEGYEDLCRVVYGMEHKKDNAFLAEAPEGATAYRIMNEWWNSFKVEYYGPKQEMPPAQ